MLEPWRGCCFPGVIGSDSTFAEVQATTETVGKP